VLVGSFTYAERRSALLFDGLRWGLALAGLLALTALLALPIWLVLAALQYGDPREWWGLRATVVAASLCLVVTPLALWSTPLALWGDRNGFTMLAFAGWAGFPVLVVAGVVLAVLAWRRRAPRTLVAYAAVVLLGQAAIAAYLAWWGMLGFRTWAW